MNRDLYFDLKQIKSFIAVVRDKSFTKASRVLGLGQATISHPIGQLEKNLGVPLIERSTKSFILTADGEAFYRFCEKLIGDLEKLEREMGNERVPAAITIAASTIPSAYIIPKALSRLAEHIGNVTFRIIASDSREAIERVKDREVDAAIVGRIIKHPALSFSPIWSDEIVLVSRKNSFPTKISIRDILNIPLIVREKGSGTRHSYEVALNRKGAYIPDMNVVMECSTSEMVREGVLSGVGAAFISTLAVERELESGVLDRIEIKGMRIPRTFYFVTVKDKKMERPVQLLYAEIKKMGKGER
jgi:DNA-binding transcriptional LysR family regulator